MENLIGEKVAGICGLQPAHELFVRLDCPERRGEVLECGDEGALPAAVRGAEEDVKIRAWTLGELSIGPGVAVAAAMKVDMGSNQSFRRGPAVVPRRSRPVGRVELAAELCPKFFGIFAVNGAGVGRSADRLAAKLIDDFVLMLAEALAVKVKMAV